MKKSTLFLIIALGILALSIYTGAFQEVTAMVMKPKFAGKASPYDDIIFKYAKQYNVDPLLIRAVIRQESNWKPSVVGFDGLSIGLMQITKPLASDFFGHKVTDFSDFADPDINIHIGTWYLAKLSKYPIVEQLAAYNGGPGKRKSAKIQREYSDSVLAFYKSYQEV